MHLLHTEAGKYQTGSLRGVGHGYCILNTIFKYIDLIYTHKCNAQYGPLVLLPKLEHSTMKGVDPSNIAGPAC